MPWLINILPSSEMSSMRAPTPGTSYTCIRNCPVTDTALMLNFFPILDPPNQISLFLGFQARPLSDLHSVDMSVFFCDAKSKTATDPLKSPKGCSKKAILSPFGENRGYDIQPLDLYKTCPDGYSSCCSPSTDLTIARLFPSGAKAASSTPSITVSGLPPSAGKIANVPLKPSLQFSSKSNNTAIFPVRETDFSAAD